ncbi:hypothetical protein CRM22_010547 [Opisthorchis felineus]|uniref:Ubiquitin carboxyl-terminal hydrolase n=1 Tax=Opisthorchis felineus TaxID=147828 RepID=A0A4S2KXA8_OPIFE|nr:hypothetical protein CRM22_010547 [Opisthorchis felineus]
MDLTTTQTTSSEPREHSAEPASECSTLQASTSSSHSDSINADLPTADEDTVAQHAHAVLSSPSVEPTTASTSLCADVNASQYSSLPIPVSQPKPPAASASEQIKTPTRPSAFSSPNDFIYHIKWISFQGTSRPIITQNENGPCPIIAIGNVLLLRGTMSLPIGTEVLTGQRLVNLLSDILLSHPVTDLDDGQLLNYETTVADAFNLFPSLQTGLDINVRFTGVSAFEFTPALSVFDLFRITLYHGWLVDPENAELISVVSDRSYNQLVERVIELKASADPEKAAQGLLAEDFLAQTASQLTYHGLCELYSAVSDGQLAVFFRNNHYNTIYKTEGRILVLVTDQVLSNEPNIVWEVLNDVDGNTQFVDEAFQLHSPVSSVSENISVSNNPIREKEIAVELVSAPGIKATESVTREKIRISSSSYDVAESGKRRTTSVEELAQACTEHMKLESTNANKMDGDLSLAVQLQLEELKSSNSIGGISEKKVAQAVDRTTEPAGGIRESNSILSSDNLPKICSGKVLALAKEELGSGSDLDVALRLQWEEVTRNERNRSEHPSMPARNTTDSVDQRRRHSATARQTGAPPRPHTNSRPPTLRVSQRSTSTDSRDNCTIL